MAKSSLTGIDRAEREPAGRDTAILGPSDSSDTGADLMGLPEEDVDPVERRRVAGTTGVQEGADIGVDRVVGPGIDDEEGEADDAARALADAAAAAGPEDEVDEDEEEDERPADNDDEDSARSRAPRAAATPPQGPGRHNPEPDLPARAVPGERSDEREPPEEDAAEAEPKPRHPARDARKQARAAAAPAAQRGGARRR